MGDCAFPSSHSPVSAANVLYCVHICLLNHLLESSDSYSSYHKRAMEDGENFQQPFRQYFCCPLHQAGGGRSHPALQLPPSAAVMVPCCTLILITSGCSDTDSTQRSVFFFFCNYPIFCNQPSSRPHGLPSGLAQAGDSLSAAPCLPPHSCSGVTATNPSLPPHLQLSSGQREEPCWKGSRLLCHPPARGLNAAVLASLSLLALIGFDEKYI